MIMIIIIVINYTLIITKPLYVDYQLIVTSYTLIIINTLCMN